MNETDTFKRLKRISLSEMAQKIDIKNFETPVAPTYNLGKLVVESSQYYNRELSIHHWRIKLLEENGWTFEEFMLEQERKAVIEQIDEINKQMTIPSEIIDRAKVFFPNIRVIQARIEWE